MSSTPVRRYKQYTEESLQQALREIMEGQSINRSSMKFNIPARTLRDWMKRLNIKSVFTHHNNGSNGNSSNGGGGGSSSNGNNSGKGNNSNADGGGSDDACSVASSSAASTSSMAREENEGQEKKEEQVRIKVYICKEKRFYCKIFLLGFQWCCLSWYAAASEFDCERRH